MYRTPKCVSMACDLILNTVEVGNNSGNMAWFELFLGLWLADVFLHPHHSWPLFQCFPQELIVATSQKTSSSTSTFLRSECQVCIYFNRLVKMMEGNCVLASAVTLNMGTDTPLKRRDWVHEINCVRKQLRDYRWPCWYCKSHPLLGFDWLLRLTISGLFQKLNCFQGKVPWVQRKKKAVLWGSFCTWGRWGHWALSTLDLIGFV